MQFVNFANNATGGNLNVDDFWSDSLVMDYYKNHLSFLLNHPNKLANGLQFKVHKMCAPLKNASPLCQT